MKFTLSLQDYLKHIGSYHKIENFKWGRSANKSEEWKSLRKDILGYLEQEKSNGHS